MPDGVDCSHHQGQVNWQQVRGSGVKFAAVKATESTTYVDPTFAANWGQMRVVGLRRTAYHFARPERSTPDIQARHFADTVGPLEADDLPLVLDLEATELTGPATVDWAASFLSILDKLTNRRSIIYTGPGFIRSLGGTASELTYWPLWVARYRGTSYKAHAAAKDPGPVTPWTTWLWWQYSDAGTVPGVNGTCDVNHAQAIPSSTSGEFTVDAEAKRYFDAVNLRLDAIGKRLDAMEKDRLYPTTVRVRELHDAAGLPDTV